MEWIDHAIWWQVYPLGFCGAPIREEDPAPAPRMRKLLAWLDYAIELGASGLLLGPVFASQTHGYDTTDQFRIDHAWVGRKLLKLWFLLVRNVACASSWMECSATLEHNTPVLFVLYRRARKTLRPSCSISTGPQEDLFLESSKVIPHLCG